MQEEISNLRTNTKQESNRVDANSSGVELGPRAKAVEWEGGDSGEQPQGAGGNKVLAALQKSEEARYVTPKHNI